MIRFIARFAAACVAFAWASLASATPAGWNYAFGLDIIENSGAPLTNHQVRLTLDTASLIGAGQLRTDGADLRFALD